MSKNELVVLKEYINKNLKKGYIKESTFSAKALILFVLKKDRKLWLVVDYKRLNNVTIKNKYNILLLNKLNNKLKRAKWFTKLDQKSSYNYIRIKKGEE
jgi:hypothetical protein